MSFLSKFLFIVFVGALAAGTASIALARQPAPAAQASMSEGEIKKVDKDAGKLTIKHGELANLGMPGMTMVFKVSAPAMLDKVKQGDKVRFVAETVGGALTVTVIDVAK